MNNFKRFNIRFLLCTLALILLAATVNYVKNPYGIWRIGKDDAVLTGNDNYEYMFKPYIAYEQHPKVIFLGNSRISWGFPAVYPGYDEADIYNLGIAGARLAEMRGYLDFALATFKPEVVVLGINYSMFTDLEEEYNSIYDHDLFTTGAKFPPYFYWRKFLDGCLSSTTLKQSFARGQAKDTYERGLRTWKEGPRDGFDFVDRSKSMTFYKAMYEAKEEPKEVQRSKEHYRAIVDACRKAGVTLKVFIECKPVFDWIKHDRNSMLDAIYTWKKWLVSVHPVTDFSVLTPVTLAFDAKHFYEMSHVTPYTGRLMLMEMGQAPEQGKFGTLLTPDNVNSEIERQKELFQAYKGTEHYATFKELNIPAFEALLDGKRPSLSPIM